MKTSMVQPAGISSSHPVVDNLIALMGVGEAIIIVALVQLGPENRAESREMMRNGQQIIFIGSEMRN